MRNIGNELPLLVFVLDLLSHVVQNTDGPGDKARDPLDQGKAGVQDHFIIRAGIDRDLHVALVGDQVLGSVVLPRPKT